MTRKEALLTLLTLSIPLSLLTGQNTSTTTWSENRSDPSFSLIFKDDYIITISLESETHSLIFKWNNKEFKIKLDDLMKELINPTEKDIH